MSLRRHKALQRKLESPDKIKPGNVRGNIRIFWGLSGALGPSDLGRGHRGDSENGRMTFWDALEPEL